MKAKGIKWGAILGCTAVILGALGAHALKKILLPEQLHAFDTAVRFQIYHALLLLLIDFNAEKLNSKLTPKIINLLIIGIFCFSGSIYLLSFIQVTGWSFLRFLGPVTPIGGLLLIISWALIFVAAIKRE